MPNTLTEEQVKKYVRSHTTDSVTLLPDEQILYFAGMGPDTSNQENVLSDGSLDLAGIIADSYEYMGRGIMYGSEQHGPVSVSQPQYMGLAALWRARSRKGGLRVTVGRLVRTDVSVWPPAGEDEFGA